MDRGAQQSIVYGVTESRTLLSDFHYEFKVTPAVCFNPTCSAPWGIWFRVSQKAMIKMLAKGYLSASRSHWTVIKVSDGLHSGCSIGVESTSKLSTFSRIYFLMAVGLQISGFLFVCIFAGWRPFPAPRTCVKLPPVWLSLQAAVNIVCFFKASRKVEVHLLAKHLK